MWSGRDGYRKAWNNQVCKMIHNNKVSLMAGHWANLVAVRIMLPTWVAHLEESLSYKEVQFKNCLCPVKTSCPP